MVLPPGAVAVTGVVVVIARELGQALEAVLAHLVMSCNDTRRLAVAQSVAKFLLHDEDALLVDGFRTAVRYALVEADRSNEGQHQAKNGGERQEVDVRRCVR